MRSVVLPLCAALLASCGGGDAPPAVLRADVVGSFDDPAAPPRIALTQATQLGLVQFDGAGAVVPGLAASWRTVDGGRSIIFRLRPATWSDGRTLKAGDVVTVFRRIIGPGSRNPLKPLLTGIDNAAAIVAGRAPVALLGVTAPLPDVVELRLTSPDAGLLQLLALPQAAIVRAGARPPSIGAFTNPDAAVRPLLLRRNARYFAADTVRLGGIALTPAPDPAAAVARFVRGQTDLVIGDGIAGLGEARTLARATLRVEATWGIYGYRANLKTGPLADPRIRRAVAMAIDREALLARSVGLAQVVPLLGLVPPSAGSATPALPDWAALDLAARRALAAQLLAAAGYGPAKPLGIRVGLLPGREHALIFDMVARDLGALGIVLTAAERAPQAQRDAIARGDYDLALLEYSAPAPKPLFFLRAFTCAGGSGYCNKLADAMIESARTMADEAARGETLARAEGAMLADTPMIPLFVPVRWALVGRGVGGWTDNLGGQHPLAALTLQERRR